METPKKKVIDNTRLEEIRDTVAKNRGYENWETLNGSDLYDSDIDEVAKMYAESETAQLQAEKAELLKALEIFFPMFTELDSEFGIENPHPRKWTETEIATVQKLFDLIQKHKQ